MSSALISVIVLALGCFWGPDAQLGVLEGVIRTRVGYSGGSSEDSTYESIGDHAEAVRVEYNSSIISLGKILDHFFEAHDPREMQKRQYESIIFYETEMEKHAALSAIERGKQKYCKDGIPFASVFSGLHDDCKVLTKVERRGKFYNAEDYHQKYRLRLHSLSGIVAAYKTVDEFLQCPIVTKLNGFVAGYGSSDKMNEWIAKSTIITPKIRDEIVWLHDQRELYEGLF